MPPLRLLSYFKLLNFSFKLLHCYESDKFGQECGLVQVTMCKTLGFLPSINNNKVIDLEHSSKTENENG